MVNFTSNGRKALLSALLLMFAFVATDAAVQSAADLFGKYKFTADVTVTEAGQANADAFKGDCEVVITKSATQGFDFDITGLGGSTATQKGVLNTAKTSIEVGEPNTGGWFLWDKVNLCVANIAGDYPFGTADPEWKPFEMSYVYDGATKSMAVADFTAVSCDFPNSKATVMAEFRNCKLTLAEPEISDVADISGTWSFTVGGGEWDSNPDATFPKAFNLELTATDATFTKYDANFVFEGYAPVAIKGAGFDGTVLSLPYDNTFIEADKLVFTDFNLARTGTYTFNKKNDNEMELQGAIAITDISGENPAAIQWYSAGTLIRQGGAAVADYTGTYDIKVGFAFTMKDDVAYPQQGESFTFTVGKNETTGQYYVTEFMGQDVKALAYGTGIPCEIKDNGFEIAVGTDKFLRMVVAGQYYDVLLDGMGTSASPVAVEVAADGTVKMGDFFIKRVNFNDFSAEPENCAFYQDLTGKKVASGIDNINTDALSGKVYVSDGAVCVKGGKAAVEVYTVSGACLYQGVTDRVALPAGGMYVVRCGGKAVKVAL